LKLTRRFLVVSLTLMHLGFAAFLNLGQFSFNMLGFFPLLLTDADWALFARYSGLARTERAKCTCAKRRPSASPGRAFSRASIDSSGSPSYPRRMIHPPRRLTSRWRIRRLDNERAARPDSPNAGRPCPRALHRLGAPAEADPGLGRFRGPRRRAEGEHDGEVDAARTQRRRGSRRARGDRGPSPARIWLRRALAVVREVSVIVLLVCCTSQLLIENNAIPQRLKLKQPKWITQIIWYPPPHPSWQMFSPDAPTGERLLYVDAVTFGGRHVDSLNEVASRVSSLPVTQIPPLLQQDEFWHDYVRASRRTRPIGGPSRNGFSSTTTGRAEPKTASSPSRRASSRPRTRLPVNGPAQHPNQGDDVREE